MRAVLYLRKKVGGLKLDELPGLDSLTSPGTTYYPINCNINVSYGRKAKF